jgi:hypothetical protein
LQIQKGKVTNICRFKKGRSRTCADFKREGHKTTDFKREGHDHLRILKQKFTNICRLKREGHEHLLILNREGRGHLKI